MLLCQLATKLSPFCLWREVVNVRDRDLKLSFAFAAKIRQVHCKDQLFGLGRRYGKKFQTYNLFAGRTPSLPVSAPTGFEPVP